MKTTHVKMVIFFWKLIIISMLSVGLSDASVVNFYSRCNKGEVFVTLAENVELIIDPGSSTVPVCYLKFTSAHHGTKLRYKFKEVSLISSDVTISIATGINNILWTQAHYDKRVLPPGGEFIMADDQFTVTVERINGIHFDVKMEITAQDQTSHKVELSQGAIVGIVFGCLLFVNVIAIIIGLGYRKCKKKKKLAKTCPALVSPAGNKQDNIILRNTLGTYGTDERIVPRLEPGRLEEEQASASRNRKHDLVAQYLASQATTTSTSVRELPIRKPTSARERTRSNRNLLTAQEQPIRHSMSARQRTVPEPFVVEEQLIPLPFQPKKIPIRRVLPSHERMDEKPLSSHELSTPVFGKTMVQSRIPWKQYIRKSPSTPPREGQLTNGKRPFFRRTPLEQVAPPQEVQSRKRKKSTSDELGLRSVSTDRTFLSDSVAMRNPFVFRKFPRGQPGSDGDYLVQE